ncbi:hypothetical protein A5742_07870 [Mycolicibacterium fortuitum]|uniref:Uncharacterized protein n=1 Tax=Mycolicibacterium fortuitum TaxID=1766 RepID=A0ABD6QGR7_MYCFO|nr:hypothetical protein [Mycolicibacterium fortuitum]OMC37990.1 hypothetical protein A5742_07870 [Mycolicibacterium fortuitum]
MARAVGATADQLREVGREDAAEELEVLDRESQSPEEARSIADDRPQQDIPPSSSTFIEVTVQRAHAIETVGEMLFWALDRNPKFSADTKAELALAFANLSIDLAEVLLPRIEEDRAFITPYAEATIALRKFVELHDYYAPHNKLASQTFYHGIRDMERGNLIDQAEAIRNDMEGATQSGAPETDDEGQEVAFDATWPPALFHVQFEDSGAQQTPGFDVDLDLPSVVPVEVSPYLSAAYVSAMNGVQASVNDILRPARAKKPVPQVMIESLAFAADDFVLAARRLVEAMQKVELDASREQIDSGMPLFEVSARYAEAVYTFIGHTLVGAPNKVALADLKRRQTSLRELVDFLEVAETSWREAGLSSEPPTLAAARTAKDDYLKGQAVQGDASDDPTSELDAALEPIRVLVTELDRSVLEAFNSASPSVESVRTKYAKARDNLAPSIATTDGLKKYLRLVKRISNEAGLGLQVDKALEAAPLEALHGIGDRRDT